MGGVNKADADCGLVELWWWVEMKGLWLWLDSEENCYEPSSPLILRSQTDMFSHRSG